MSSRATALALALLLVGCGDGGAPATKKTKPKGVKQKKESIAGAPAVEPVLTRAIRAELRADDFDALEARFAKLQSDWEADPRTEPALYAAWLVFKVADETLAPHHDAWVEARPDSATAHAARGYFHAAMAVDKRGARSAGSTSADQFRGYEEYGSMARADLKEAMLLRSKVVVAMWQMIAMEQVVQGDRDRYYEKALGLDPASSVVRFRYLHLLQPKWGGSMEKIAAVVRDAAPHVAANPRLAALAGYPDYVAGNMLFRFQNDAAQAEEALTHALAKGEASVYYRERADIRNRLGKYAEAVADCDRALELLPEDSEALEIRAGAYLYSGNHDRGLQDLDASIEIDPSNSWALYQRGYLHCMRKEYTAALEDEKAALAHDPGLGVAWGKAGFVLLELDRPAEAVAYLEKARETLKPGNSDRSHYLFCLAIAHYHGRNEQALPYLEEFIASCGKEPDRRHASSIAWARKVLDAPDDRRWTFASSIPR